VLLKPHDVFPPVRPYRRAGGQSWIYKTATGAQFPAPAALPKCGGCCRATS